MTACGSKPAEAKANIHEVQTTYRYVEGEFVVVNKFHESRTNSEDTRYKLVLQAKNVSDHYGNGVTDVNFELEVSKTRYDMTQIGDVMTGVFNGVKTPEHMLAEVKIGNNTYLVSKTAKRIANEEVSGNFMIANMREKEVRLTNPEKVVTNLVIQLQSCDNHKFYVEVEIPHWNSDEFTDIEVGDIIDATYMKRFIPCQDFTTFKWAGKTHHIYNWWTD
jgi:hypothetical protein